MTPQSTRPYIKQEPINDSPAFRHLNSLINIPISHFTAVNPANENPKDPRINKLSHRLSSLHLSPTEKWLQNENERLKNELMHVKIQLASARWKLKQGVAGVQGNRSLEDTQVKENAGKELKGLARMEKRILNRGRGGIEMWMKGLEIRGGSGENKAGEGKMRVEKVPEAAKLSERTVRIKAERPSEKSLKALKGSAKTALGRVQTGTSFLDNVIEVMKGYCRVQGQCFYVKREDIQDFKY
ncbi:Protein of unknown function [Pyronema omphalodes CBS 100304]|uniref:Uncharacterized protein n=1 Tax=Pyronema omphalodes (strain CBS 100304) TaxID=1076935 RepID=U4LCR4_PYROM|nr:Protein of unknown function [Pyronema omphalodes CBS 100304]